MKKLTAQFRVRQEILKQPYAREIIKSNTIKDVAAEIEKNQLLTVTESKNIFPPPAGMPEDYAESLFLAECYIMNIRDYESLANVFKKYKGLMSLEDKNVLLNILF